jgi:hypothetical protein
MIKQNQRMLLAIATLFSISTPLIAQDDPQPDMYDQQRNNAALFANKTPPTLAELGSTNFIAEILSECTFGFNATYGYNYKHSFIDGSSTEKNSGAMSLLINAPHSITLQPSLGISESGVKSISGSATTSSLGISPALQGGMTFLSNSLPNQSLGVSGTLGYNAADSTYAPGQKLSYSQSSGWRWAGGLSYTYKLSPKFNISLSPSYSYNQGETVNYPKNTTSITYSGTFSAKLGVVYRLNQSLTLSPYMTWFHSVAFSTPTGQNEQYQGWAQFGGDVTYNLVSRCNFSVGYAYEAFNTYYYTHSVSAGLTVRL